MARTRRQAADAADAADAANAEGAEGAEDEHEWREKRRAHGAHGGHGVNGAEAGAGRRSTLVQTALAGVAGDYVMPDHEPGKQFPGRQASTTQLSLFETGFKRKSGQLSLLEAGLKRLNRWDEVVGSECVHGC